VRPQNTFPLTRLRPHEFSRFGVHFEHMAYRWPAQSR
jgi:hypothetical protein